MKKTVPLKKELTFKNNLAEITSIALDHDLSLENRTIRGNLVVSGSYKMNDISINTEDFNYNIPVNIEMSDHYELKKLEITVDDFYYEVINSNILNVSIEIGLDNLEEKELPIPFEKKVIDSKEDQEEFIIEKPVEDRLNASGVKSLFDSFDDSLETYSTYKICIIKENDTVESICIKYSISREMIEQYNDLSDLKIGDKLIIPALLNDKN